MKMPVYVYECDTCGVRFERTQKMTDPPLTDCPECEGHVHRVVQPVGIVFKGSGFYVTDNRKATSATLGQSEHSSPAKEEDKKTKTSSVNSTKED